MLPAGGAHHGSRRFGLTAGRRPGGAPLKISRPLALAIFAACAAAAAALLQIPGLNGPAEWRWPYRPLALAPLPALAAILFGAAVIAVLLHGPRGRKGAIWIALLGYGFILSVVAAQPNGFGRVVSVLASRHSFSYLYDAALAPGTRELLADFPAASAALSMHSRTHPPGVLLAIRGLDRAASALGPAGALGAPLPRKAAEAMAAEISRAKQRGKPAPAVPPSPMSAVALAFLLPLAAAATALPVFSLGRSWGLSDFGARSAAALWVAVPAAVLFTPSLDQALAGFAAAGAALAAKGAEGRRGDLQALAAGVVVGAGCLISYGLLVAVPFVAWVALASGEDRAWREARRAVRAALVGLGFLLPWLALALLAGYEPWRSFRAAISAHREMAVATRSYATWLFANPYDFALFCGPAVAVLAVAGALLRRGPSGMRRGLAGGAALFVLLWLSGSVRGEVGRIWLFAMPFVALAAAGAEGNRTAGPRNLWAPGLVVAAQALATVALAASMVFVD